MFIKKKLLKNLIITAAVAALLASCVPVSFAGTTKVAGVQIPDQYKEGYQVINCLDISKYQKDISYKDFETIKKSGVGAVIVRAGYSSYDTLEHKPDKHFADNVKNAYKAGLDVGVYYFSAAVNADEAKDEAEYFVDLIAPYRDKITLPVVMDLETNQRGRFTASVMRSLGVEGCTEMVESFLDVVEGAGYDPMLYASRSVLDNFVDSDKLEKKYKIWLAQYPRSGQAPSYDGEYYMWQYSSNVRLEGIDARVDANYLFEEDASAKAEVVDIGLYTDDSDEEEQEENSGMQDPEEMTVSFHISDGVTSEVPIASDAKSSTVTVTDKTGYVHTYKLYKSGKGNQTETTLASLFNGFFTSKHEITPEFIEQSVLPAVFREKYAKNKAKDKVLSMNGICNLLNTLGLNASFRRTIGDDVYVDIKTHLIKGKPVILWTRTNNKKWGTNKQQIMLLIGMDESGYAIMVDPVDRKWSDDDQRVKLVSVTELVEYMKNAPDNDNNFTEGVDGGYILVDK